MKRETFNYIKRLLKDYKQIDNYIKRRHEELQYPYRPDDVNADIKGNAIKDSMANMVITIDEDTRLNSLKRNKEIIQTLLDECDEDTKLIIEELYTARFPRYTIQGLVDNNLLNCGRSKAYKLRDVFFVEMAKEFNLDY